MVGVVKVVEVVRVAEMIGEVMVVGVTLGN